MSTPTSIAESVVGPVEWQDADSGYCTCPGADLHTSPTAKRHTRVCIDGAPTVYCVHSSCKGPVDGANLKLRRAMAKGTATAPYHPTPEQIREREQRNRERLQMESLQAQAKESFPQILSAMAWTPEQMREESPSLLYDDHSDDWRLLIGLMHKRDAVIWIGDVKDSCDDHADDRRKDYCRGHFRTAAEWLKESDAPGQFTCPSTFKNSVHSRSNENVIGTPFLVVESDTLRKEEMGAIFRWMGQFLHLRAIVDTAGKSLHGWFDRPEAAAEKELRTILPALGCDPALFKLAQPCRLPGAKRGDNFQKLLYLNSGGAK